MPSVFKYGEFVWNDLLVSNGGVRIGTLRNFRKDEHKRGVADAMEGIKSIYHGIDHYDSGRPFGIDHAAIQNLSPFRSAGGAQFSVSDLTIERQFEAPDCYLHCTAHSLSKEVLAQFEGADSCVEIFRSAAFYKKLTEVINKKTPVHFFGLHLVRYAKKREAFSGEGLGIRPELIKEPEFSPQCELRAIWIPKSKKKIEPFDLEDKSLRKFCRMVEIP